MLRTQGRRLNAVTRDREMFEYQTAEWQKPLHIIHARTTCDGQITP